MFKGWPGRSSIKENTEIHIPNDFIAVGGNPTFSENQFKKVCQVQEGVGARDGCFDLF